MSERPKISITLENPHSNEQLNKDTQFLYLHRFLSVILNLRYLFSILRAYLSSLTEVDHTSSSIVTITNLQLYLIRH